MRPDEQFWMVWNPEARPPAATHDSEQAAWREAERLAGVHPGQRFYVVHGGGYAVKRSPIERVTLPEPFTF